MKMIRRSKQKQRGGEEARSDRGDCHNLYEQKTPKAGCGQQGHDARSMGKKETSFFKDQGGGRR